jgi:hypothetical protein
MMTARHTPAQRQDWEQHYQHRIAILRSALRATLDANDDDERRDDVIQTLREDDALREEGPS